MPSCPVHRCSMKKVKRDKFGSDFECSVKGCNYKTFVPSNYKRGKFVNDLIEQNLSQNVKL